MESQVLPDMDVKISKDEFQMLTNNECIPDNVINRYLQILQNQTNDQPGPKMHCVSSNAFEVWTRSPARYQSNHIEGCVPVNANEYSLVFVPVNISNIHWALFVIDRATRNIEFYDSLQGSAAFDTLMNSDAPEILFRIAEAFDKREEMVSKSETDKATTFLRSSVAHNSKYKIRNVQLYIPDLPMQPDGFNCGIFCCRYAECRARGTCVFDFESGPGWLLRHRRKMAKELEESKIDTVYWRLNNSRQYELKYIDPMTHDATIESLFLSKGTPSLFRDGIDDADKTYGGSSKIVQFSMTNRSPGVAKAVLMFARLYANIDNSSVELFRPQAPLHKIEKDLIDEMFRQATLGTCSVDAQFEFVTNLIDACDDVGAKAAFYACCKYLVKIHETHRDVVDVPILRDEKIAKIVSLIKQRQ